MIRDVRVIGHLDAFLSVNQLGILVHILCIGLQCWGRLEHTVMCVCEGMGGGHTKREQKCIFRSLSRLTHGRISECQHGLLDSSPPHTAVASCTAARNTKSR